MLHISHQEVLPHIHPQLILFVFLSFFDSPIALPPDLQKSYELYDVTNVYKNIDMCISIGIYFTILLGNPC
jgi:hypothetical protein